MDPVYTKDQMEDALVAGDYESTLEDGGPDIVQVFGSLNSYEDRTRFFGAESDIIYNIEQGNLEDTILLMPEGIEESIPDASLQNIYDADISIQRPDRDLHTTADDWKSAFDIASDNDTINSHTSDYHSWKTYLSGLSGKGNRDINVFGFPTDRSERKNIWKHNVLAQTGDTARQIYKMAKQEQDF